MGFPLESGPHGTGEMGCKQIGTACVTNRYLKGSPFPVFMKEERSYLDEMGSKILAGLATEDSEPNKILSQYVEGLLS